MHMKRNIALAVALGLLAVPAFSDNNVNAASNFIPSTNIPTGRLSHSYDGHPAGTIIYDGHGPGGAAGSPNMENGSIGHVSDNNHPLVDIPKNYVTSLNSKVNENNTQQGNTGAQYGANKNTLPQTGEVNNQTKRIVSSIILGTTGLGLSAVALKKHKNQKKLFTSNINSGTISNNGNEIDYLLDNIKNNTVKLNGYTSEINSKP